MTIDRLREAYKTQPFIPFTICLTDGRSFRVPSSECLFIPPQASRTFVVASTGEDYKIIDLLLVTSLDFHNKNGKSNGRSRRKH